MATQGLPVAVWTNLKLLNVDYEVLIGLTQEHISGIISGYSMPLSDLYQTHPGCVTGIYSFYNHLHQISMPLLTLC